MPYGNYYYIIIENFPQKFSPCMLCCAKIIILMNYILFIGKSFYTDKKVLLTLRFIYLSISFIYLIFFIIRFNVSL